MNYYKPKYPQPHNIKLPKELHFDNSAAEFHAIIKGHAEAKYYARREVKDREWNKED